MHVLMSFESDELMSSKVMSKFAHPMRSVRRRSDEVMSCLNSSAHQAIIASKWLMSCLDFFFLN